jgi:hypothetical protein
MVVAKCKSAAELYDLFSVVTNELISLNSGVKSPLLVS